MTFKEALQTKGYWFTSCTEAQRQGIRDWIDANASWVTYRDHPRNNFETVYFSPIHSEVVFGVAHEPGDDSHLWVSDRLKLRDAILALGERRIVLPVTNPNSPQSEITFIALNGGVIIDNEWFITNADFIALATHVRNTADPDIG